MKDIFKRMMPVSVKTFEFSEEISLPRGNVREIMADEDVKIEVFKRLEGDTSKMVMSRLKGENENLLFSLALSANMIFSTKGMFIETFPVRISLTWAKNPGKVSLIYEEIND